MLGKLMINPLYPPIMGEVCIGGHPQTPEGTTHSSGSLTNCICSGAYSYELVILVVKFSPDNSYLVASP